MNTASARPINVQFSGSIPRNYDEHLGPLFFEPFSELLAERIAALAPSAVLELACGTGRLTRHIAQRLDKSARMVATDINPAMLEFAKQQLPNEDIEWNAVDAVSLPYPDKSFDLVVVQFGVMFYSDRMQAYREALRALRPVAACSSHAGTVWTRTLLPGPPRVWWRSSSRSIHPRSTPFRSPTTKACASMKTCSPPGSTTCRWNCSRRRAMHHRRRCGCGSARRLAHPYRDHRS
ncbi:MAG: class I SAM-dependent methyltransferase [Flavobacteriales bacterium]|nr:class I SAM-dependent methyltransferase [Flavobacteriales bacterium]